MRGPDWDEPMDEDQADRIYAAAFIVFATALSACVVLGVRMIWQRGLW